jgi:hypothetical protein
LASPPPATINLSEDTEVEQQQPSFLFISIQEGNASERGLGATSPHSGRETPASVTDAKPDSKSKVKGRDRGAMAYSVEEHVAALQLMLSDHNAFNASESSVEWQNLHLVMCKKYYLQSKSVPRSSATLHGHVVEMYGAFKKAVRIVFTSWVPKCPKSYLSAADNETSEYANSLYSLLISDKKYMPKSWWSAKVVSMLLALHLEYTSQFEAGEQSLEWLDGKSVASRTKF